MKIISKIIAVLLIITTALIICACAKNTADNTATQAQTEQATQTAAGYKQISSDEGAELIKTEKDFIILDVRTKEEYASGHIPNAICVPNESIGTSDIPELPDKSQLILVYCRSGRRSKEAAQKLADMGYTNIVEFGGIIDWKGETVTD